MPKRSFDSPVLVWPKSAEVIGALRRWAESQKRLHPLIRRIGYFGSLAGGDYGVGSDADLVIVVSDSRRPPMERPLDFDPVDAPVSTDVLVYTEEEWAAVLARGDRFSREMSSVIWL